MRPLAIAAGLAAVAGCYRGPSTDDPTAKNGNPLPRGIATPGPANPSPGPIVGIFKSLTSDDPSCCWLGASASFPVRVRAGASVLRLVTFIPNLKLFQDRVQAATVSVDGGPAYRFPGLTVGRHRLEVPLRPQRRDRIVRVAVQPGFTFVPIKEGITPDGRTLSLYLRAVVVK